MLAPTGTYIFIVNTWTHRQTEFIEIAEMCEIKVIKILSISSTYEYYKTIKLHLKQDLRKNLIKI